MFIQHAGYLDRIRNIDVHESNIWTQYWNLGYRSTSGDWPLAQPDVSMVHFWRAQFIKFPLSARILDLGCGNGELTRRAHEFGVINARSWHVSGLDSADIGGTHETELSSALAESSCNLRFFGGMSIEKIELENASQDVVLAQHALEYTDLAKSIAEISRVCDYGAKVYFVLHTENSIVAQNAKSDVQDHLKIRASGFFGPEFLSRPRLAQRKLRWDFHETGSDLIAFAVGLSTELGSLDAGDRAVSWQKACAYLDNDYRRLQALLGASQTKEQRVGLVGRLIENCFEINETRILKAPDLDPVAYFISATRRASKEASM